MYIVQATYRNENGRHREELTHNRLARINSKTKSSAQIDIDTCTRTVDIPFVFCGTVSLVT